MFNFKNDRKRRRVVKRRITGAISSAACVATGLRFTLQEKLACGKELWCESVKFIFGNHSVAMQVPAPLYRTLFPINVDRLPVICLNFSHSVL